MTWKVNHIWLTDLRSWFKNLKELHRDWVEIGDVAPRATAQEMSCHRPVTPDLEKKPIRAAVAYLVRGVLSGPQSSFQIKVKFVRCFQREVSTVWFIWYHVICRCWSTPLLSHSDVMLHYKEPFMEALPSMALNHTQSDLTSWWSLTEV